MTKQRLHLLGRLTSLVKGMRQMMAEKPSMGYAILGLVLLVPSAAIAATATIEKPFTGAVMATSWFSEETSGSQAPGSFFWGVLLRGSYSNDLKLRYYALEPGYTMQNQSAEFVVSDETGAFFVMCPTDTWISSVRTSGSYSDNVHFRCSELWKGSKRIVHSATGYFKSGWYSEEVGMNDFNCPVDTALTGFACADSYCDDMSYVCMGFR